jgi:hypothetical protein
MEKKAEFAINFKKYREHCQRNGIQIPHWMNHIIFKKVIELMENHQKLQACKYLTELSKENKTRYSDFIETGYRGYDFGLKWSKNEVCDVIESFRVHREYNVPVPTNPSSKSDVSIETIKETIRSFAEIAERCFGPRSLVPNEVQVVLKTSDLRKLLDLYITLNQYGEL